MRLYLASLLFGRAQRPKWASESKTMGDATYIVDILADARHVRLVARVPLGI